MKNLLRIVTLTSLVFLHTSSLAEDYPKHNIQIIVGFDAGGGTDIMARTVAPILKKHLPNGIEITIQNKPGAGGQIGWAELAKAKPDGYTLGTMNLPSMVAKLYDRKTSFGINDFSYIGTIMNDPSVVIAKKDSPFNNLTDVIEAAKKSPGSVTYSVGGLGGEDHFAAVQLENISDVDLTVVPFGGAAPARAALLGGHVSIGGVNLSEVEEFKEEVKILAIFAKQRSKIRPDVMTASEQGFDVVMSSVRGIAAPAGLDENVKQVLVKAFDEMAKDEEFVNLQTEKGFPLEVVTGENYDALVKEQNIVAETVWNETPWK